MELKEFAEKLCIAVQEELGGSCKVELAEVRKNNGVIKQGLQFRKAGQKIAPLVYLSPLWEEYESGVPFWAVTWKMLSAYHESTPERMGDMEFFRHFDEVRERICFFVVRKQGNDEFLAGIPHVEFLDLAVCPYYSYQDELGEGIIRLYDSHRKMWGITTEELVGLALQNTPRVKPYKFMQMEDALREAGYDVPSDMPDKPEMYVLSNAKRSYGAACLLYPRALQEVSGGKNLFIIPSSVHETIIVPDDGQIDAESLRQMISIVNREGIAPEEVLSDSLYYYDAVAEDVRLI